MEYRTRPRGDAADRRSAFDVHAVETDAGVLLDKIDRLLRLDLHPGGVSVVIGR